VEGIPPAYLAARNLLAQKERMNAPKGTAATTHFE